MRHLLISALLACSAILPGSAQILSNGYYRVQNAITQRYAYITDNKGKINAGATSVDAMAIELWKGFEKASHDPACILYFESQGGKQYNITAQGTSIYQIVTRYINIISAGSDMYYAYGEDSGMAKYLGDPNDNDLEKVYMSTEAKGNVRKWWIKPVSNSVNDNYFGVLPTVQAEGKYYKPWYSSFPFSTNSSGMKVYYIKQVGHGMAVKAEVTGTVPGSAPVYVECSTNKPTTNRLNIGGSASALSANKLKGVYFCSIEQQNHFNALAYDAKTMRVLGVGSDGKLAYITDKSLKYIPANESYLVVEAGSPEEIKIVTQQEYDNYLNKLPTAITLSESSHSLYAGQSFTLSSTITPSDASNKTVTWTSSNTAVATVSSTGVVKAVASGTAVITATTVNDKKATCSVTVNPAYPTAITVSPTTVSCYEGDEITLTANPTPATAQNKTVTWSSSNASIATVDANGKVKAVKYGSATITATTANGLKATSEIIVKPYYPTSVTIPYTKVNVRALEDLQISVSVLPEEAKDKTLIWTSSDEKIAKVKDAVITGVGVGVCTITASSPGGAKASCEVNVVAPYPVSVTLDKNEATLEIDQKMYLYATVNPDNAADYRITWSSTNENVVTVNSLGQIRGRGVGNADVIVETSNGKSATCHVTVTEKAVPVSGISISPLTLMLMEGDSDILTAEVHPDNATDKSVVWSSSAPNVVSVDNEGHVKALAPGVASVKATAGYFSASCYITVQEKEKEPVLPTAITISDESIALEKGESFTLSAEIEPSDVDDNTMIWSSSNPEVAKVSNNGVVTAVGGGETTISVSTVNSISAHCNVIVTVPVASVTLDTTTLRAIINTVFYLSATVLPEDATNKTITWKSSNTDIATVTQDGEVTVLNKGNATITATANDGSGKFATCEVDVVTSVESLLADGGTLDVYTVDGILLIRNADAEQIRNLSKGVYLIGGNKIFIR